MGGAGSSSAGGGRATRLLRLLLLLVLALAAVEFLFGSILDASPLRTYLYTPIYNATQPTIRYAEKLMPTWPKTIPTTSPLENPKTLAQIKNITTNNNSTKISAVLQPPDSMNMTFTKSNMSANITIRDIPLHASTPTSLLVTKLMDSLKNFVTTEIGEKKSEPPATETLPLCSLPSDLGPVKVNSTELEPEWVEKLYPEVQWGGRYIPPNCTARHKVAIIVPYRDRRQHLGIFLNHMHPFLMKQQIEYGIFIVEQDGNKEFNRGKLMNVGFMESQKLDQGSWQCFIFHDIDLLPLDTRNLYSCTRQPRHLSAAIDKFNFRLPYEEIFGGVSAMTLEQFHYVNGYSNKYWGWGGEDDDMFYRLWKKKYHIARYKMSIARYTMLKHKKSWPNPKRYQLLSQARKVFSNDGLNNLEYELVQVVQYHLYTHILANIDERS